LARNEDLDPIGQRRREVQRLEQRARAGAPRRIDRVDHPRALFELVHAGTAHPTGDVHEDHDLRRRAGRRRSHRGIAAVRGRGHLDRPR
jgi:hypothetical protein